MRNGIRPVANTPSNCKGCLGLRSFGLVDWRVCLRVGAEAAWATDCGELTVQAMLAHLRISGVVLPPATVLERIGLARRHLHVGRREQGCGRNSQPGLSLPAADLARVFHADRALPENVRKSLIRAACLV
jgi:hypothetical protein